MRTDNHQVNIRVNEAEYAKIQASARIMGLTVPKYCKHLVMQSKLKEPKLADEEYHKIIVDLSRIGNNINQIARQLNQSKSEVAEEEWLAVKEQLEGLDREVAEVWQRLR
jgi:t-SNARE complex subunit (syntaxin)